MGKPLLSIILPIYNVERYLKICIDSILRQNVAENLFEIVLVNDGSTDGSGKICDYYEEHYKNIFVYHRSNGGLSDARNAGLMYAKGKYVAFVDSDDCLVDGALPLILDQLKNREIDVLMGDACLIDEEGSNIDSSVGYSHSGVLRDIEYTGENFILAQLKANKKFLTTVWLGIYSRYFLLANALLFEIKLLHEDEMWTPKVLLCAEKVRYLGSQHYCYRIRQNSIMRNSHNDNANHVKAQIFIYESLIAYYDWKIENITLLRLIKDDLARRYLHSIIVWNYVKYPILYSNVNAKRLLKISVSWDNIIRSILLCVNKNIFSLLFGKLI